MLVVLLPAALLALSPAQSSNEEVNYEDSFSSVSEIEDSSQSPLQEPQTPPTGGHSPAAPADDGDEDEDGGSQLGPLSQEGNQQHPHPPCPGPQKGPVPQGGQQQHPCHPYPGNHPLPTGGRPQTTRTSPRPTTPVNKRSVTGVGESGI